MISVHHLDYNAISHEDRLKITCNADVKTISENLYGNYDFVAEVDTDSMDVAYEKTNNIEESWVNNDGVYVNEAFKGGARSTSVGDLLICGRDMFIVDHFGFTPLRKNRK